MDRHISAYALAEEIESLDIIVAGKPARWNDAKHTVLRIIAEQPTSSKLPVWIPLPDRLPDVCGMPVLMVVRNRYGQRRVVQGFTDYSCPVEFHTNDREFDGTWHAWGITHWMPLPELPESSDRQEAAE